MSFKRFGSAIFVGGYYERICNLSIYRYILQKEALKVISRQLKRRFGDIDASLVEQVRNLSAEQLKELGEDLLDFSEVADLVA
ncbi:DUF4351 domain-containing protein [Nostoc sp. XA010]|uniref:DUF4351 domain-containing protein n=1 Tax=Nostoc sp. XA010 TaxID=2780407 RepID=UPI001E516453|nr:DUF4351 domain-containing protein [Nostoc sp. XA010]MCC5658693.1 DUF4351 domain-containing protein [Nostoc sp. XA010]